MMKKSTLLLMVLLLLGTLCQGQVHGMKKSLRKVKNTPAINTANIYNVVFITVLMFMWPLSGFTLLIQ